MLGSCRDDWAASAAAIAASSGDGMGIDAGELKSGCATLKQSVVKLGAAATAVTDAEVDTLAPAGDEVCQGWLTVRRTLEALAGDGETWQAEISEAGAALSEALVVLGAAVQKDRSSSSRRVGDVLERMKRVEKLSLSQKASVRKVILLQIKQMRDARRELAEASAGEGNEDDLMDEDDFGEEMDDDARARATACDGVLSSLDAWWTAIVRESPDDFATLDALAKLARRCAAAVDATVSGIQLGETEDSGDLAGVLADLTVLVPPPEAVDTSGVFEASE
jgi:hypothetical protein